MILKYNIYTRTLAPDMLIDNSDANFHGVQKKQQYYMSPSKMSRQVWQPINLYEAYKTIKSKSVKAVDDFRFWQFCKWNQELPQW